MTEAQPDKICSEVPLTRRELTSELTERLSNTLGELRNTTPLRVAAQVRQAARAVFERSPAPRPTAILKQLEKASRHARNTYSALKDLSDYVWLYAGIEADQKDTQLRNVRELADRLERAVETARDNVRSTQNAKGGRHADSRIQAFVLVLAMIYKEVTGNRPTYTIDPNSGGLASPFGRFAAEAFRAFYPGDETPWGAVSKAVQHAVAFERDTEPFTPPPEFFTPEK